MKIALQLCGFLRSYKYNFINLKKILLDKYDIDIYLYISSTEKQSDQYINSYVDLNNIIELYNPISFIYQKESNNSLLDNIFSNLNNQHNYNDKQQILQKYYIRTYKYWNKIYQTNELRKNWETINNFKYDIVITMRPDLFLYEQDDFINKNIQNIQNNILIIPEGNNISDINKLRNITESYICDRMCIGNSNIINIYCNLFNQLITYYNNNISLISETVLNHHLQLNNVTILREEIKNKLILSICNSIAIVGDSGSGKTTLSNLILPLFNKNDILHLECDRYHKWERTDTNWKNHTHLNPDSNHIDKMTNDIYNLKIGNSIYQVDYDHSTGKFTEPDNIESKETVILCGLHCLHNDKINNLFNLKIYIDTEDNLKKYWKIQRDFKKRNYDIQTILKKIEERHNDYIMYILPQRNNADIIIHYETDNEQILNLNTEIYKEINIKLKIKINYKLKMPLLNKLFNTYETTDNNLLTNYFYLYLPNIMKKQDIINFLITECADLKINYNNIEDFLNGELQLICIYQYWLMTKNNNYNIGCQLYHN
jgi:uridine kinase